MIKLFFILFFNLIRWIGNKLFYGSRFKVHLLQRISPSCSLKLYNHGSLVIGKNCEFSKGCDLEVHGGGRLQVGDHVYMNRYCMVSCQESVNIGSGCIFGPGVKIFDNNHQFSKEEGVAQELNTAPITIGCRCWIASDVIILKGVTIGDNCLIGAGCIISEDIPSGSMVKQEQRLTITKIRPIHS